MYTLKELMKRLGNSNCLFCQHEEPVRYNFANFQTPGLTPQFNTLYICEDGYIQPEIANFPFCGVLVIPVKGQKTVNTSVLQCEWAIWDITAESRKLCSEIQFLLTENFKIGEAAQLIKYHKEGKTDWKSVLHKACEIMGNPIAVFDTLYNVIAMESLGVFVDNIVWKTAKREGCLPEAMAKTFRDTIGNYSLLRDFPFLCDTGYWKNCNCLVMQIVAENGSRLGSVAVYAGFRELTEDDPRILIALVQVFSRLLENNFDEGANRDDLGDLLRYLIYVDNIDRELVDKRIKDIHWRPYQLYRLGYIKMKAYPTFERQKEYFCKVLNNVTENIISFIGNSGDIYVLICADNRENMSREITNIEKIMVEDGLKIGISDSVRSLDQLKDAGYMAEAAFQHGSYTYNKCGLLHWKESIMFGISDELNDKRLHDLYTATSYHRMKEYDKRENTEFCFTMVRYISNQFKSMQTARQLFIHKNSLLYRINRICDLFDIDLANPYDVSEFWAGYQIHLFYQNKELIKGGENIIQ